MNALNPYVWQLYRHSFDGTTAVEYFSRMQNFQTEWGYILNRHGVQEWIAAQDEEAGMPWELGAMPSDTVDFLNGIIAFAQQTSVETSEQIHHLMTRLVSEQVKLSADPTDVLTLEMAFDDIHLVTLGLHLAHPEVFVPYAFQGEYYIAHRITAAFGIALPPIPAKHDLLGRWFYFAHYSAAFQEFRRAQGMSVPELLAFLNDFAVNYVLTDESELPSPRHAWLMIGSGHKEGDYGELEEAEPEEQFNWQGSLDMLRGDVCVMYVRRPISAVHSLCRVVEDAYEDPFFHFKQSVQIGQVQRVPRIPFRTWAAAPVMSKSQHVRRNFQGTSGQLLSREEYDELLSLLVARGFDVQCAPRLPQEASVDLTNLANERDVERLLVEPLLERIGLMAGQDWVRQLPVRMGRGERVYPDYVIGVTGTPTEQRVRALIEVKYRAAGERDWREAFRQAKSYAMRLGAKSMLVAAAEGVRLFTRQNDDFHFENGTPFQWDGLREGKSLLAVRKALS